MTTVLVHIHHPEFSLWNFPDELGERWRERFAGRDLMLVVARGEGPFAQFLPEADALIGGGLRRENFADAGKLRWVQTASAGVGHLLFPELVASPLVVTNARGVHAAPMAEHLLGLMLALVRKIHRARDHQLQKHWAQDESWLEEPPLDEIGGRTLGVVGLGSVGRELAWRAAALGMRVLGVRRHAGGELPRGVTEVRVHEELDWLLAESDFVANCLPGTPRTEKLFDAERFARCKPGAVFLNVGRGATVDESALIEALRSGRLAAAGLDVTAEEPLPEGSPLWTLPQVLITPHTSGASARFWERAAALFEENLERFLDGRMLLNQVDKREGY